MVTWCTTTLAVQGPPETVDELLVRACAEEDVLQLARLLPVPRTLHGPRRQEWQRAHWGCAPDLDPDDVLAERRDPRAARWHFHTVDRPPDGWTLSASALLPRLVFRLSYAVPDLARLGQVHAVDGRPTPELTWEVDVRAERLVCAAPGCYRYGQQVVPDHLTRPEPSEVQVRCPQHAWAPGSAGAV